MKKFLKYLVLFAVFSTALFIISDYTKIYADSQIYFDDNGNFVFATYDKKATSKIRYKTIGWLIKKYDEPRNVNGQIYGIIPKPEFYYSIEDVNNPGYRYTYFIVKKDEIMNVIKKVSPSWKAYLEKYGGTIYLDSVMTVVEYDSDKGGLNADGTSWGEVYYDYDGISGARWWAKPQYLLEYFDIPITFPKTVTKPAIQYTDYSAVNEYIKDNILVSTTIGSHSIIEQEYDIDKGIPSGEDLYAYGLAAKYYCEGILTKRRGMVKIPSKVTTDYLLKWTDSYGVQKSETVRVERWYYVQKPYEYYEVASFNQYKLSCVKLKGDVVGEVKWDVSVPDRGITKVTYGSRDKHMSITEGSFYAGTVTVNSTNNRRPDIPDENQQSLAEKGNASCKIRNDRLVVGTSVILNDGWSNTAVKNGITNDMTSFYKTDILMEKKTKNGQYDDTKVFYVYACNEKSKEVSQIVESITVHTPVIAGAIVFTPKKYNMSVEPESNQIVLGTDFRIKIDTIGCHNNIKGYGYGDYEKYIEKTFVKLPFSVTIGKKKYEAETWIELDGNGIICNVPKEVRTGNYKAEIVTLSYNSDITDVKIAIENGVIGENGNFDISQYGAKSTTDIEVIGTIYGFAIKMEESTEYYVGNKIGFNKIIPEGAGCMPMVGSVVNNYRLIVESDGFGSGAYDTIIAKVKYYYINDGKRQEVNVYTVGKHDLLSGNTLIKAPDEILWTENTKVQNGENQYIWETDFILGESIVAFPKDVEPTNNELINEYALRKENILINFEIYGYCGKKPELTYNNVENSWKGYCNMWKTEGYNYEFVDKAGEKITLLDGDALFLFMPPKIYEDYEVIGTH